MKICKITSRNFRTLEDFELNLQPNYCAISGKNNAGKSAIVKIIQYFFSDRDEDIFFPHEKPSISFSKDHTQWSQGKEIEIAVEVELHRTDDSEVFFLTSTFTEHEIKKDIIKIKLSQKISEDNSQVLFCNVDGEEVERQKASEILKKFRTASNLVVHNSTAPDRSFYYLGNSFTEVMQSRFSQEDQKKISDAEKRLQSSVKRATRQHKEELEKLLGKLNEKYHVELSTINRDRNSSIPLNIKLTDKSVEVPLSDWGAGTQNRTRILMSVLDAIRIRSKVSDEDRSTPVFLVEEPESFLHPSAQAEFGQVLNGLAEELQIQIIATTHSPYMLNQSNPSANILLERKIFRNLPRETYVKANEDKNWMLPFAENLGIIPSEFDSWKPIFGAHSQKALLVEGPIDQDYFLFLKENYPNIYTLNEHVEILPYGGKDSLKNTSILQFMIKKFGKVYITFDLDAKTDIKSSLERIGLIEDENFCSIGIPSPGSDCIEGLLPASIKQKVYSEKHELVSSVMSQDTKIRNHAKSELKKILLQEFKNQKPSEKDLQPFKDLFKKINTYFEKK